MTKLSHRAKSTRIKYWKKRGCKIVRGGYAVPLRSQLWYADWIELDVSSLRSAIGRVNEIMRRLSTT